MNTILLSPRASKFATELACARGMGDPLGLVSPPTWGETAVLFFTPAMGLVGLVVGALLYGLGGAIIGTVVGLAAGFGGTVAYVRLGGAA